jgi:hypothetical protein
MLVQRTEIPASELLDFEQAIRANGHDPGSFTAQMFQARPSGRGGPLRRVHVVAGKGAAQYDAGPGTSWIQAFAKHLARGIFG